MVPVAGPVALADRAVRGVQLSDAAVAVDAAKSSVLNSYIGSIVFLLGAAALVLSQARVWSRRVLRLSARGLQALLLLSLSVPLAGWLMFLLTPLPSSPQIAVASLVGTTCVVWLARAARLVAAPVPGARGGAGIGSCSRDGSRPAGWRTALLHGILQLLFAARRSLLRNGQRGGSVALWWLDRGRSAPVRSVARVAVQHSRSAMGPTGAWRRRRWSGSGAVPRGQHRCGGLGARGVRLCLDADERSKVRCEQRSDHPCLGGRCPGGALGDRSAGRRGADASGSRARRARTREGSHSFGRSWHARPRPTFAY